MWKLLALFITKLKHRSLKKLINRVEEFRNEIQEAECMQTTMVSFDPSMSMKDRGEQSAGHLNRMSSAYSKANSASSDKSKFKSKNSRDDASAVVKFEMPLKSPKRARNGIRLRSGMKNYMAQNR